MTLTDLARKHGTDKFEHGFCPFYERFFGPIREEVVRILEIGLADGGSARMWLDYFPKAEVYGLDNGLYGDRGRWPDDPRFHALLGDQSQRDILAKAAARGPFDIVIDDGSHTMHDQQVSLGVLWPQTLRYYVVEDLHTSFMPNISLYTGPHVSYSYPTGVDDPEDTTYDLLLGFRDGEKWGRTYMTEAEYSQIRPKIHVFEPSRQHITAVLERMAE